MRTNFTSSALRLAVLRAVSFIQQTVSAGRASSYGEIYHAKQSSRVVQSYPSRKKIFGLDIRLRIRRISPVTQTSYYVSLL